MTANRIAINTLSRIVREAEKLGPRVKFITESAIKDLVTGSRCYVINLSSKEKSAMERLGFHLFIVLPEARGEKDLCELSLL